MESTFAGVPTVLTGKKFPQNIRAMRMVAEELLKEVTERNGRVHNFGE